MAEDNQQSSLSRLRMSFVFAGRGLKTLVLSEQNARIHLFALLLNIVLGISLGISRTDWCLVICAMALVWMAEAQNTAIEFLCDRTSAEYHPLIEKAKDVAAGAVLAAALGSLAIGVLVYGPPVLALL